MGLDQFRGSLVFNIWAHRILEFSSQPGTHLFAQFSIPLCKLNSVVTTPQILTLGAGVFGGSRVLLFGQGLPLTFFGEGRNFSEVSKGTHGGLGSWRCPTRPTVHVVCDFFSI